MMNHDKVIKGVLSGILLILTTISHAAYLAPVGIPAPSFCVDETSPVAPAGWPASEVSGYYYIDNSDINATDSSNPYGYPDQPRVSIPTSLVAGEVVEIHGGPYTGSQLNITASGTSGSPIWFRGASATSKPTLRREIKLQGSYINLENLYFDTSRKTIRVTYTNTPTDHVCIRHNEFAGAGIADGNSAVLSVSGDSGSRTSDVVIYNNPESVT